MGAEGSKLTAAAKDKVQKKVDETLDKRGIRHSPAPKEDKKKKEKGPPVPPKDGLGEQQNGVIRRN
ncbi:hypothetical protein N7462_011543 [Penicillium macrosclerotiorum]|uniref:uncharacterized protein n=1 Tax=Penicillium macrosclerotiorum TaxID=303699 RepID=UPI0025483975|nr:uncharacterized protein N7462_011543 [Penicillium macrosclerotiorum]KAJ5664730.1 hypothetical protein N7462_011543 [Penicillium macrosclerotiorum]